MASSFQFVLNVKSIRTEICFHLLHRQTTLHLYRGSSFLLILLLLTLANAQYSKSMSDRSYTFPWVFLCIHECYGFIHLDNFFNVKCKSVTRNDKVRSINRQKSRSSSLKIQRYKISGLCPTDFRSR